MSAARCVLMTLALVLTGCGITAPQHGPGYADLGGLSLDHVDRTLSLSFGPAVLRLVANGIDDDPKARELLRNLDGVRVRVFTVDGDPVAVAGNLDAMSERLGQGGWEPVVRIHEAGETTHVLMKLDEQRIAGITVLTADSLEVVLVNVMGELRPELFSDAMHALEVSVPPVDV